MTNWGSQLIFEGIPLCSLSRRYHLHFLCYAYFTLNSTKTHIVLPYLLLQDHQEMTKFFVSVTSSHNILVFQSQYDRFELEISVDHRYESKIPSCNTPHLVGPNPLDNCHDDSFLVSVIFSESVTLLHVLHTLLALYCSRI